MTKIEMNGSSVEVATMLGRPDQVTVEVDDGENFSVLFITPGDAVRISRALVAAAAEALGVKV